MHTVRIAADHVLSDVAAQAEPHQDDALGGQLVQQGEDVLNCRLVVEATGRAAVGP